MITSLAIENFALIDSAKIDFTSGFTVITGETGSGKSILLNALNLILGERANFSVIGNHSDKSVVEAEIDISDFDMNKFFLDNELDYFDKTIVRREIYKQGRSRAFINDVPVQLTVLKEFTSQLIHIHSQYNTLELKDLSFQLKVLDILADLMPERLNIKRKVLEYRNDIQELEIKKSKLSESVAQEDYNKFQLTELQGLNLSDENFEELKNKVKKAENADEILTGFAEVGNALNGDSNVLNLLNNLASSLTKKASLDPKLEEIAQRIASVIIELDDLAGDAERGIDEVEFDPRHLEEALSKLDAYNRVLQKHGVNSQDELIELMNSLAESFESNSFLVNEIELLEKQCLDKGTELEDLANELHTRRQAEIPAIENSIKMALSELKLENTELIFKLSNEDGIGFFGNSKLEILFSPNIGIEPVPVHLAASGGELSRVMLALQSLMSSKTKLRTVLFDEIDTGVSGDVAQKMGITLKKMGEGMQVIAITHLPQVAGKGGQHLKVIKGIESGITMTSVIELNQDERVEEVARLMSGDKINEAALENAKSLIK